MENSNSTYKHKNENHSNKKKSKLVHLSKQKTAILVDGAFFVKRYRALSWNKPDFDPYNAKETMKTLYGMVKDHLRYFNGELYRIFYYDCAPLTKKIQNPINNKPIDLAKSKQAVFMNNLFNELKMGRKVALRLGVLNDSGHWKIKPKKTKGLLNQKITVENLDPDDVEWEVNQKQVDMKMGLDIAALSYKSLVDQVIMIAGDSDFVPVAKVARREGIDFILDPMFKRISPELSEHIDGLHSPYTRKNDKQVMNKT